MTGVQFLFGIAAAISAALFLVLAREEPKIPPCEDAAQERALMLDGLKNAFSSVPFLFTLAVAFVGLGIFNGVSTWGGRDYPPQGIRSVGGGNFGRRHDRAGAWSEPWLFPLFRTGRGGGRDSFTFPL